MSDNIVPFIGFTVLKTDADDLLEVTKGELDTAIIVGLDHDGELYFAGNISDEGTIILLLEKAKKQLLED